MSHEHNKIPASKPSTDLQQQHQSTSFGIIPNKFQSHLFHFGFTLTRVNRIVSTVQKNESEPVRHQHTQTETEEERTTVNGPDLKQVFIVFRLSFFVVFSDLKQR